MGHVFVRDEAASEYVGKRTLLLSDPRLDFWVRVEITELADGRHEAIATIEGEPLSQGIGDTQQEAMRAALEPLGEPYASDISDNVTG